MNHRDHVFLIEQGVQPREGAWADLGSGTGAFTLALAELLGASGEIYSVDRNGDALREQERAMRARFPDARVKYVQANFAGPLELPPLAGIVMANSLHFTRDHVRVLQTVKRLLAPGGRLVLVEYNADQGNPWVPHPLSFETLQTTAVRGGFANTRLLATRPSSFMHEIYSAVSR